MPSDLQSHLKSCDARILGLTVRQLALVGLNDANAQELVGGLLLELRSSRLSQEPRSRITVAAGSKLDVGISTIVVETGRTNSEVLMALVIVGWRGMSCSMAPPRSEPMRRQREQGVNLAKQLEVNVRAVYEPQPKGSAVDCSYGANNDAKDDLGVDYSGLDARALIQGL